MEEKQIVSACKETFGAIEQSDRTIKLEDLELSLKNPQSKKQQDSLAELMGFPASDNILSRAIVARACTDAVKHDDAVLEASKHEEAEKKTIEATVANAERGMADNILAGKPYDFVRVMQLEQKGNPPQLSQLEQKVRQALEKQPGVEVMLFSEFNLEGFGHSANDFGMYVHKRAPGKPHER